MAKIFNLPPADKRADIRPHDALLDEAADYINDFLAATDGEQEARVLIRFLKRTGPPPVAAALTLVIYEILNEREPDLGERWANGVVYLGVAVDNELRRLKKELDQ